MARVLFIHPEGNFATNPSLRALSTLLVKRGHSVEFAVPRSADNAGRVYPPGLRVNRYSRHRRRVLRRVSAMGPVGSFLSRRLPPVRPAFSPDVIIGVDQQGLLEGGLLGARLPSAALVYLSYELTFAVEGDPRKQLEKRFVPRMAFAISQDRVRAELLSRELEIPLERVLQIPVAGTGSQRLPNRTLHKSLGIAPTKRIALLAGSVAEWTMARELVNAVPHFPSTWVLVIHDRLGRIPSWLRAARERFPHKLFLSGRRLGSDREFSELLCSAELGLAFYRRTDASLTTGRNIEHIGMSSGKISTYMQHGLPVATNEIGEMADHIRSHGLGLVVRDPRTLGIALRDFDPFDASGRALSFFRERLDTELYISLLEERLHAAVSQRAESFETAADV